MSRNRSVLSAGGILVLLSAAAAFAVKETASEEFVGPFPSWANVRRDYGAVGDGKVDDTTAIQKAFDDLRLHEKSCVLYFPAGTYRITDTVKTARKAHQDCMGVTVLGEDPATTVIKWEGKEGGMMVKYDAWYSKISRLTLDGAGKAGIALAYGDAFSTYNETSDMVLKDVVDGLSMGTADNGQAENAVLRCQFLRCSGAGIRTNNFNSLDIWAWYCRFEDCGHGMFNGAGNFHAYRCLFLRSKKADIGTANLMVFSFVNNTSIRSNCFLDFSGGHTWGSPCSVTGNRIIEPTGDWAVRLSNGGPYLVMDNIIKARPGVTKPVVEMTWGDQVFVGNTYSSPNPVKEAGKFRRVADSNIVAPKTLGETPPVLPPTPPNRHRRAFDVPAGADAGAIQAAIDTAVKLKGQGPVVHVPKGNYSINRTLTIPAGSDLQLVGDGAAETATVLRWTGEGGGLLLKLEGPSRAVLRDLSINIGQGNGLRIENCDQRGGKIHADQLNITGMSPVMKPKAGLLVNGVEDSDVLMQCLQGATFCEKWVDVVGGPRLQAGKPANSQIAVYCGATGTADAQYAVEKGGRLVVRSVYHEMSGDAPQGILLNHSGSMAVDATRFSYKTAPDAPLIRADGFKGDFALLTSLLLPVNSQHTAGIEMTGDGKGTNLLCAGNLFWVNEVGVTADKVWTNKASQPAHAAMLLCNMNSGVQGATRHGGFDFIDDRGEADDAFILKMLKPLREARVWWPGDAPVDVTNVRIHRVLCTAGKGGAGVELRAGTLWIQNMAAGTQSRLSRTSAVRLT